MTTVDSIQHLLHHIAGRVKTDGRILWFRGQRDAGWDVTPGIQRGYHASDERNFTNRFRSRAGTRHQDLPEYDNAAAWLSLMQHYHLPTRLLDWTRSPLIGLYFALEDHIYSNIEETDACIWILEPHLLNEQEGFETITPPIDAHMCRPMLDPAFTHREEETGRIMAVMAAEGDLRMFSQQGCFTIHSYQGPLNKRPGSEGYLKKCVIPRDKVKEIAFHLDIAGFRKGDIYPDLGNLSAELKGRHRPRSSS